jgi:hypothetical protein
MLDKLTNFRSLRRSLREKAFLFSAALALSGLMISPSLGDLVFGANGSANIGNTTNADGSVTSGSTSFTAFGGEGTTSFSFNTLGSIGEIDTTGFAGSQLATPLLRLRSDGPSATEASGAFIGSMTNYQYIGPGSADITYDFTLTADLTENGSTNSAFLRARAAFITEADFFSTNVPDFFESTATVEDSYRKKRLWLLKRNGFDFISSRIRRHFFIGHQLANGSGSLWLDRRRFEHLFWQPDFQQWNANRRS